MLLKKIVEIRVCKHLKDGKCYNILRQEIVSIYKTNNKVGEQKTCPFMLDTDSVCCDFFSGGGLIYDGLAKNGKKGSKKT